MKKIISIMLTLLLVLGCFPVFAKEADNMTDTLKAIKPRIMDTEEFETFSSDSMVSDGETTYEFNWSTDEPYKSLSVSCNKDGIITSYFYYNSKDEGTEDVSGILSKEQIAQKAQVLLNRLNPDLKNEEFKIESIQCHDYGESYSFKVKRYVNGVAVKYDRGYFETNADVTNIKSFNLEYTEIPSFESIDGIKTPAQAKEAFKQNNFLKLLYSEREDNVVLEYKYLNDDLFISAKDLSVIKRDIPYFALYRNESAKSADMMNAGSGGGVSLSPAEQKEIEEINNNYPSEELYNKLINNKYFKIGENPVLSSKRAYKTTENRYYYSFAIDCDNDEFMYATVDAQNGNVISFYAPWDDTEVSENAKELAVSALKELSDYSDEFVLNEEYDNKYDFIFNRVVNGISFEYDNANITVDKKTGKICSFNVNRTYKELPDASDVVSKDEALNAVFEKIPFDLYYVVSGGEAKLVYDFSNNYISVDAKTGTLENYTETAPSSISYTDIEGHYAEEYVNIASSLNIYFNEKEFKPEKEITQGEFIQLMYFAQGYSDDEAHILNSESAEKDAYEYAKFSEILSENEIDKTAPITREQAAVYVGRRFGIKRVAEMDIYKPIYNDTTSNLGYINITSGYGIFKGDENGNFNPGSKLTRADSFIIFCNMLKCKDLRRF